LALHLPPRRVEGKIRTRHMAQDEGGLATRSRAFALSGAGRMTTALALLALVGLASTSQLDGGGTLSPGLTGLILLVLVSIASVGIAAAHTGRRTKLIVGAVTGLVLTALITVMLIPREPSVIHVTTVRGTTPGEGGGEPKGGPDGGGDANEWLAAVVGGSLLAALVILAVAIVVAKRRRRRASDASAHEEEAVVEAVEGSLDDLRHERDVRRAIIACYARMERALERAGNARRPGEAPFEYLARVLERITASGRAARALTVLFERAKFSVEPMGEREKQQAIGALELLRAEVSQAL
jgi:hypothetical protein